MVCARLVGWFEMRGGVLDGYMYGCRRLLDRFVFRLAGNEKKRKKFIFIPLSAPLAYLILKQS